jgi:hypothetical protein
MCLSMLPLGMIWYKPGLAPIDVSPGPLPPPQLKYDLDSNLHNLHTNGQSHRPAI